MKKLLLIAATTAALSTSALANETTDNTMYLRVDAGADMFTKSSYGGLKLKPKAAATAHLGLGNQFGEGVRGEVVYSHHFSQKLNASSVTTDKNTSVRSKSDINALMAKGYYDFYDAGSAQFFIGAGVGVSRIHEVTHKNESTTTTASAARISASKVIINGVVQTPDMLAALNGNTVVQSKVSIARTKKTSYQFAYSVALGAAIKASEAVTMDVQYNFSDFGKATAVKHRGHTVIAGIRFSL